MIAVGDRVYVASDVGEWYPRQMVTLRGHVGVVDAINGPRAVVTFSDIIFIIRSGVHHPVPTSVHVRLANLAKIEEQPS